VLREILGLAFIDELFKWTSRRGARQRISKAARRHCDPAEAHFDDDRIVLIREHAGALRKPESELPKHEPHEF